MDFKRNLRRPARTDIFAESNPHTGFVIGPQDGEVVVTRRFFSGFTHSDLDIVLRAAGIDRCIVPRVLLITNEALQVAEAGAPSLDLLHRARW